MNCFKSSPILGIFMISWWWWIISGGPGGGK